MLVDHFKVVRPIGRGGMGEVYLARDTKLGRKVALKLIRPEALGDQEAVDRFGHEARTTAKFSHPHIVQVYFVGEKDGRPYVALEFLEGDTLRDRMGRRAPSPTEVIRIGLAIAEALVEAHEHGVLHRDLKPENVIIPPDGRLRVVDFGMAKSVAESPQLARADTEDLRALAGADAANRGSVEHDAGSAQTFESQGAALGTPLYMAPEQWHGDEPTGAVDVWALGVVLHELLSVQHPFESLAHRGLYALAAKICADDPVSEVDRPGVPAALRALVQQCVAKQPEERPSAAEVVQQLGAHLRSDPAKLEADHSPFRGLLPFAEEHASLFFGRDAEIDQFVERLLHQPVLPVVGPSGAGKSSFVQAGVIPRLLEQSRWLVLKLRPGSQPFDTLAGRLVRGPSSPRSAPRSGRGTDEQREQDLRRLLRESPGRLAVELQLLAEQHQRPVLLFVDQLEELYALGDDPEQTAAFMDAICKGADDPDGAVRVVFTVRDDFQGRLAATEAARDTLGRVTVLRSPGRQALRAILTEPLRARDYSYEDEGLVDEMVDSVEGESAALALLQFAAEALWQRRDREARLLTRAAYEELGGVEGALAQRADTMLAGMVSARQRAARHMMLRLVTADRTRRSVPRGELLEGAGDEASAALDQLIEERIVLQRKDDKDGHDGRVELAHESLIEAWKQLSRWLDESREEHTFVAELTEAAELWDKRDRPAGGLWHGGALADALRTADRLASLPSAAAEFLAASKRAHQRRSRTVRIAVGTTMLLLGCLAAVLLVLNRESNRQRVLAEAGQHEAAAQRKEADHSRVGLLIEGARWALDEGNMLEARAKLRTALTIEDDVRARAMWMRLSREGRIWQQELGGAGVATWMPGGDEIAVLLRQSHGVQLFDAHAATPLRIIGECKASFALHPDGREIACGHSDGVVIKDLETGEVRLTLRVGVLHDGSLRLIYDATGKRLAILSGSLAPTVWSTAAGDRLATIGSADERFIDAAFRSDGELLTLDEKGIVRSWNADTGQQVSSLEGDSRIQCIATAGADQVAVGYASGHVAIARGAALTTGRKWKAHGGAVRALALSPNGGELVSFDVNGSMRIWDTAAGVMLVDQQMNWKDLVAAKYDPGGSRLLLTAELVGVQVWDTSVRSDHLPPRGPVSRFVGHLAFSPDGRTLAEARYVGGGWVMLWDVATGRCVGQLSGHPADVFALAFSPDGRWLASGCDDNIVRLWDAESHQLVRSFSGHEAPIREVVFHPESRELASASKDGTVRVWDALDGRLLEVLDAAGGPLYSVDYDPQGEWLAAGSSKGILTTWNRRTGAKQRRETEGAAHIDAVRYNADGSRLASGGSLGTVRVWDRSGHEELLHRSSDPVDSARALAFHPQEDWLLVGWARSVLDLWRLDDGTHRRLDGQVGGSAVFSPDGRYYAVDPGLYWTADARPAWFASIVLRHPPRAYTHRGWIRLDGEQGDATPPPAAWRKRAEEVARRAWETPDGGKLCLLTFEGQLEMWDMKQDARVAVSTEQSRVTAGMRRPGLWASPQSCLGWGAQGARLLTSAGAEHVITRGPNYALNASTNNLYVSSDREVVELGFDGTRDRTWPIRKMAMVLPYDGGFLVAHQREGDLDFVTDPGGSSEYRRTLSTTAARELLDLQLGPRDTIIAVYSSGDVRVLDARNGEELDFIHTHGRPDYFFQRAGEAYVVTGRGDHYRLDLSALADDYCTVLRDVWRKVPVVWSDGVVARASVSSDHPCAKSAPASE